MVGFYRKNAHFSDCCSYDVFLSWNIKKVHEKWQRLLTALPTAYTAITYTFDAQCLKF